MALTKEQRREIGRLYCKYWGKVKDIEPIKKTKTKKKT